MARPANTWCCFGRSWKKTGATSWNCLRVWAVFRCIIEGFDSLNSLAGTPMSTADGVV